MMDIFLLVLATCFDSLCMSIAYGVEKIKIPRKAVMIIAFCGTFFLGLSMTLANVLTSILPASTGRYISFAILFLLGFISVFQAQVKHYVRKHKAPFTIKFKEISFVVDVFLDEKKADMDESKDLNMKEALYLGIALSIDSMASGLAYGIGSGDIRLVLFVSFLFGIVLIYVGNFIGKRFAYKTKHDYAWISGVILLVLAFSRLY